MRPPHYYDQGLWPNAGRSNGVPLNFLISVFHIIEQKTSRLCEENLSRAEGSPANPSFPERGNVSHISLRNMANRLTNKKLVRLEGWPTLSSHPFVMVESPS